MRASYMISCAVAALLSGAASANAADQATAPAAAAADAAGPGIEAIVVTAQRRDESVQKVPMTVQAMTGLTLQKLNVTTLDDILKYTPNVTFANNGPGQGNIYMRGLSAGFAGNQSSATAGNFPNVAVYLDDQSMQFPARNVDIYMADMERVEVLEGPQGTLFGGGAEAGAVRYITNKPKLNVYSGAFEGSYGGTVGGGANGSANVVINLPVIQDKLAVRAVIYDDHHGGYINNVPSTFTRKNSDLGNSYFNIQPGANGLCPNGLPPAGTNPCSPPNSGPINNYNIAHKNWNPADYLGGRVEALYQINDDWNVLISESAQHLDAEGISAAYPIGSDGQKLQPLQITAFNPSYEKDSYENTAWTINGKIGPLKAVYTGSYMSRHISEQMDYVNYSRTAGGMYYQCVGGGTGWAGSPSCYSPNGYWQDTVKNTHLTNEVRLSTPDTWRIRAIGGVFFEDFKIYDDQNFNYRTIPACNATTLPIALAGGATCVGDVGPLPGTTTNHPGLRSDSTAFGEDAQRGYDQDAVFGSVDFDVIPDVLTVTAGTRWYRYSEYEVGTQYGTSTACANVLVCSAADVNIDAAHDHKVYTGFRSRANVTWHITPNVLTYFTFSQGFRPGGFNRSVKGVAKDADGFAQYEKPNSYAPDSLTNYEIGFKSELLDHRLQFNLSAYYMQWENVQFLFFNPTQLGNTTFGVNGPNYEVKGVEAQFVGRVTHELTVQGSASYNDATQANSPCLVANIATPAGDTDPNRAKVGQCITEVKGNPFQNPFGSVGSTPAFSPKFQGTIRARYEREIGDKTAFATVGANYTGSMFNQPATYQSGEGVTIPTTTYLRYKQPSYTTYDASAGIDMGKYTVTVFGANLGNSHASMFTSSAQFIKSEVPLRPTTYGVKINASF
ncbi:TonB-dependent receptor [Phenylobacterium montanum]|uniref:TonB-dependent receptor n=1 Tax=Phenylobacterium montanum TaxID=2823693 RepID=A0A975G225_9CAUL|nr:TonB-dependent receptor [Caulobacter sp. S6]QUD89169.1 TonB-dependent receptor [Caulobacter sp. S6]